MFPYPEIPVVPSEQCAEGPVSLRYEDIAQDGRLLLHAIPHGLGEVMFAKALSRGPVRAVFEAEGIVPILTRLVVEGLEGPISVRHTIEGVGGYELAHAVDSASSPRIARILLNVWLDVFGPKGVTYGAQPDDAGRRLHLGRVYAEHAFTRPFGPPDRRKVRDLPLGGARVVPQTMRALGVGQDLLRLPEGATALDAPHALHASHASVASLVFDDAEVVFGLGHTDSNQHVNSLVYPYLFEQAALRRLAAHGRSTTVLARHFEMSYRKPCFAGDRMKIALRAFTHGEGSSAVCGAVGAFVPAEDPTAKPHAWARIAFRP